jgi:hypothetical protein
MKTKNGYGERVKETITRVLPGDDLHSFGASFKLLVDPLNDIRRPERPPFFRRKHEKCQTCAQGVLQAFNRRGNFLLPTILELGEKFLCLLFGRGIKDRPHAIRHPVL